MNPLRQLLFIRSFGIAAQEFFQRSSEYTPFGSKSWRCRNPFCLHYNNHGIEIVTIGRNWRAKPVGLFECECGFSYTIVGPYLEDVDEQRPWLVQNYGPIWEEGVHSLWNEAQSSGRSPIMALAEKLEVPYEVARYHAARLGLHSRGGTKNAGQAQRSRRSKTTEKTQESRRLIAALLKENSAIQKKSLDNEGLKAYEWLRVHDSKWFNENWPKQTVTKYRSTVFLDWTQLDAEHVDIIERAALKIKQEAPPVQITKSELMRRGVSVRIKHSRDLRKMPRTMALLEDVLESPTQVAIRRVAYLCALYKKEQIVPTRAAFLTRGSLYPYVSAVEVDEAVNLALLEIIASQNG